MGKSGPLESRGLHRRPTGKPFLLVLLAWLVAHWQCSEAAQARSRRPKEEYGSPSGLQQDPDYNRREQQQDVRPGQPDLCEASAAFAEQCEKNRSKVEKAAGRQRTQERPVGRVSSYPSGKVFGAEEDSSPPGCLGVLHGFASVDG